MKNQFHVYSSGSVIVLVPVLSNIKFLLPGIIPMCPGFNIPDYMEKFYGGKEPEDEYQTGENVCGRAYIETMLGYDVYSNIAGFKKNFLILHRTEDFIVNISYCEKAVDTYDNTKLIEISGASNGFNSENKSSTDYDGKVVPPVLTFSEENKE